MTKLLEEDFNRTDGAIATDPLEATHAGYLDVPGKSIYTISNQGMTITHTAADETDAIQYCNDAGTVQYTTVQAGVIARGRFQCYETFPRIKFGLFDDTPAAWASFQILESDNASPGDIQAVSSSGTTALSTNILGIMSPIAKGGNDTSVGREIDLCVIVRQASGSDFEVEWWVKIQGISSDIFSPHWLPIHREVLTAPASGVTLYWQPSDSQNGWVHAMNYLLLGTEFDFEPSENSKWRLVDLSVGTNGIKNGHLIEFPGQTIAVISDADNGATLAEGQVRTRISTDGDRLIWTDGTTPFGVTTDIRYASCGSIFSDGALAVFAAKYDDDSGDSDIVVKYSSDEGDTFGSEIVVASEVGDQDFIVSPVGIVTSGRTWAIPFYGSGGRIAHSTSPSTSWSVADPDLGEDIEHALMVEMTDVNKIFMAWKTSTYLKASWCHSLTDFSSGNWGSYPSADGDVFTFDGKGNSTSLDHIMTERDFGLMWSNGRLYLFTTGNTVESPTGKIISMWVSDDHGESWTLHAKSPFFQTMGIVNDISISSHVRGVKGLLLGNQAALAFFDEPIFSQDYTTTVSNIINKVTKVVNVRDSDYRKVESSADGSLIVNEIPFFKDRKVTDIQKTSRGATIIGDRTTSRRGRRIVIDNSRGIIRR